MEIVIRSGDREVIIRDKRPVLEPDVLSELLAAARGPMDDDVQVVSLPFGFTKIASDSSVDDTGDPEEEDPDDAPEVPEARCSS